MKSKMGLLVIAAAGVGAALLFSKKSNAQSGLPPGWTPPDGASFSKIQPGGVNATGLVLDVWRWADAGSTTGGTTALVTNAANPATDFAAFFVPASGGNPQLLTAGTTANSGLIAQAGVAGLIQ